MFFISDNFYLSNFAVTDYSAISNLLLCPLVIFFSFPVLCFSISRIFTISFIVSILIDIYSHLAIFIYYLNIPSFDYLNLFIIHVLKSFLLNSKSVPTQSFYRWFFFWWGGWSFVYYIFCLNIKHCRQYQVATLDSVLSFRGLLVLFRLLCFNNQLTRLDSTAK